MADDFDPFDDIFGDEPVKNTKAVGKFRPKPKLPPKKVPAKSSVASSKAVQTVHSAPHDSSEPIQTAKSLEQSLNVLPNDNTKQAGQAIDSAPSKLSQPIIKNAEQLEHGSDAASNDKSKSHAKSVEENADVFTGSKACTDFLLQTNTKCTIPSSEEVTPSAPNAENLGGRVGTQVVSSIDDSTNTCNAADVTKDSDLTTEVDDLAAGEPIVSSADVHDDMDNRPVIEDMDIFDSVTGLTAKSGQRTGKFQPKRKQKIQKKTYEASNSTSYSLGLQDGPLQPDSAENKLIPTSRNDDAVDLSSAGTLPAESTSGLPLNEESINLMETSRRAKTRNSKTNAASDPHPQQQKGSSSSQENGSGRSLRPRKRDTRFSGLVDEEGDETLASGKLTEERPSTSALDEENINIEQPQLENEPQKKNSKRKSKKPENDKEKPPRKSKKAKEASEQQTSKQKKFSHSTRRKRVLDESLLNIPEDDFDPREISFRDLILLAEHREKQMKTGQAAGGVSATQQSTGNSDYNDDRAGQYDEEEGHVVEDTTEYFNYQSRMEKIPRVRWTKQDTELFYEAIQQFGTDFSMIAQLFPGRTREQIRNKYKKEERQHPLRIREAVTNRGKDLSYFGTVIENLNKIRAEQEELEGYTSAEEAPPDEDASNADDDGGKHKMEEEENGDATNDAAEVRSTAKPEAEKEEVVEEEDEDDEMLWSTFKSDL